MFMTFWFVMGYVGKQAIFLRSKCSSIAIGLQPFRSRFAVFSQTAVPFVPFQFWFIVSCCRLVVAVMLVCAACPVSVAVRPVCLGSRDLQGTRDTTPVSCIGFASCQRCTAP